MYWGPSTPHNPFIVTSVNPSIYICPREDAAAINNDYARELDARKRKVMIKQ
jgi:hypothetical protein